MWVRSTCHTHHTISHSTTCYRSREREREREKYLAISWWTWVHTWPGAWRESRQVSTESAYRRDCSWLRLTRQAAHNTHNNNGYIVSLWEAQLILTNCAMCLEVSQGQQTCCHFICFLSVCYSNFVCKTHRFWGIWHQKVCDLENPVRGMSRSFEMSSFNIAHKTSYWRSMVIMALSRIISEMQCRKISRP